MIAVVTRIAERVSMAALFQGHPCIGTEAQGPFVIPLSFEKVLAGEHQNTRAEDKCQTNHEKGIDCIR